MRRPKPSPATDWQAALQPEGARAEQAVVFSGVPDLEDGRAILFDSSRDQDAKTLPQSARLSSLSLRFAGRKSKQRKLDRALSLLLFVGDLSSPRAKVRLADLLRGRGERPLNVLRRAGQVVQVILVDPTGAWADGAPKIEVKLGWQKTRG